MLYTGDPFYNEYVLRWGLGGNKPKQVNMVTLGT